MMLARFVVLPSLLACLTLSATAQEQQFADLGDFKLASGEAIRDCRIGYRTFGRLDEDRSNAILFPTWANGTTEQLKPNLVPGGWLDLSPYYVIAVDALGNGVSSSPSNSRLQPRMSFPRFTMRDMVESQHALLTRVLHLDRLKAIIGMSMGGMQTFQWMVSYPGFMDQAIPIVGSPRLAPYDLMHWQTQIDAIVNHAAWKNGDYTENPTRVAEVQFGALLLTTPDHYNAHTTRQQVFEQLEEAQRSSGAVDANNKIRQVQAMMALDVSETFGGSMEAAAAAVKAKVLVIVSRTDHVVTPGPALEFARRLGAQVLELDNNCGHLAPNCEEKRVAEAVHRFLGR
jgi:homoserine O-acetyltransferase